MPGSVGDLKSLERDMGHHSKRWDDRGDERTERLRRRGFGSDYCASPRRSAIEQEVNAVRK